jgi:hypothetical protein
VLSLSVLDGRANENVAVGLTRPRCAQWITESDFSAVNAALCSGADRRI